MKKLFLYLGLALLVVLMSSLLTAAVPAPNVTFNLVQGLPATMNVGDTVTVIVEVTSDVPFNSVQVLPDDQYPGRGVVPLRGGDRAGSGTSATMEVTFTAKTDTSKFVDGKDQVAVALGVRFAGGVVVTQYYPFEVTVP